MSLPPHLDPVNLLNPSSQHWRGMQNGVVKRWPPTRGDWLITGFIVGLFALGIVLTIIQQHFS